jgi:hypothetical protein
MESTMSPVSGEGVINLHFCTLGRDTWSHKSATGLINKMLSRLFPPVMGKQTSSLKRACACESTVNDKNPPV